MGKWYGLSNTRLNRIWRGFRQRCYNPNQPDFKYYGGRGITVCPEWKDDFKAFYDWAMSNGYQDNLTLDRIDCNGNYEPSNCRWVTMKVQTNNKRCNIRVVVDGKEMSLKELSKVTGIKYTTLYMRYRKMVSL